MVTKNKVNHCLCVGFHWLSMIALVGLFVTGNTLAWMGQSPTRVWLGDVHVWMGLGLLGLTLGRLVWAMVAPEQSQLGWRQRIVIAAVIVASIGGLGLWFMPETAVNGQAFFWQICLVLIVAHLAGVFYYQEGANLKTQVFSSQ